MSIDNTSAFARADLKCAQEHFNRLEGEDFASVDLSDGYVRNQQ